MRDKLCWKLWDEDEEEEEEEEDGWMERTGCSDNAERLGTRTRTPHSQINIFGTGSKHFQGGPCHMIHVIHSDWFFSSPNISGMSGASKEETCVIPPLRASPK